MIIETRFVSVLRPLAAAYYGTAPQPQGDEPVPLPVIVVNRAASRWPSGFVGTDPVLSMVSVQVDYYAETAEAARRLADEGRSRIIGLDEDGRLAGASLDNEFSTRDDVSRAWRVLQQWTASDYSPAV